MKKIVLTMVIVLGSLSIYASVSSYADKPVKIEAGFQDGFNEINNDAVPAAIKTALQTAYPGATLVKAYVKENAEYKLDIQVGENTATVYSDVNGNWLKI